MTEINVMRNEIDISEFYLIEGLPGVGLVAKIVTDYLVDLLEMETYAQVFDSDLSNVVVFEREDSDAKSAMRIMVNEEENILVLKSDSPISANNNQLNLALMDWIDSNDLKPIFQVGLPLDVEEGENHLFHIETGNFESSVKERLNKPPVAGGVGGPTGALLNSALERNIDSLTLVVESDPNFPDPAAAKILIDKGIEPITGISVDTSNLRNSAEQIKDQKRQLWQRLKEMNRNDRSEAYPREMYE